MVQMPLLSAKDRKRETALRHRAEQAAQWDCELAQEVLVERRFSALPRRDEVLDSYEVRRAYVSPQQTVSAFYAVAKKTQLPPGVMHTSLHHDPRLTAILSDLTEGLDVLSSAHLGRVLMGMAYMQLRHEELLLRSVCKRIGSMVNQMHIGDLARTFYALGRLEQRGEGLIDILVTRVILDVRLLHPPEIHQLATGLRALRLKPKPLLAELSRTAVTKIADFGSLELSGLLAALCSLGWHHEPLLRAAAVQLPLLYSGMNARSLCETAAAYATAQLWLAPTLKGLAEHATHIAVGFDGGQAATMLNAFSILRWDHQCASPALGLRLLAQAPWLSLTEVAVAVRALTQLPLACEPETLEALLRSMRHAGLPVAVRAQLQPQTLQMLGFLCNALQHHGATPSMPLLQLLRELCAPARECASKEPLCLEVNRRARAQLQVALESWELLLATRTCGLTERAWLTISGSQRGSASSRRKSTCVTRCG